MADRDPSFDLNDLKKALASRSSFLALPESDIPALCASIRAFLVDSVTKQGGHLASNLGVTELTVAIHREFDPEKDHIIFDVGHQAYVHKMLTGRLENFSSLRTPGGLSGFTSRRESPADPFGAGHSSTSLSAAVGFASADRLKNSDAVTVCVIGDGAYTGGMIHEAMNNCDPTLPLVIVLNENHMSISSTKGAFASYLSSVRSSVGYNSLKSKTLRFLNHLPLLGVPLRRFFVWLKSVVKAAIYRPNYFEQLGLYYIGTVDGNNYRKVREALATAKNLHHAVIVHVRTQKGKGYPPAEKSPDVFHNIRPAGVKKPSSSFHEVFADALIEEAKERSEIVGITAAMGGGTGLTAFEKAYPKRFFDVGIAEEHALTFSAGLAANGLSPFVAIYSTFLQRGYDSILHDIALQDLPVRMMIDRAGLAVADGPTHHGIFDVAFLSHIPNVEILSPANYDRLRADVRLAAESHSPIAVRYPNEEEDPALRAIFKTETAPTDAPYFLSFDPDLRPDCLFLTYGTLVSSVLKASALVEAKGFSVGVILIERLKPFHAVAEALLPYLQAAKRTVFAEEGIENGGAAMLFGAAFSKLGYPVPDCYRIAAIDDSFVSPDHPCDLYEYTGLSPEALLGKMTEGLV